MPAVGDLLTAADKGYRWRRGADGRYELTRAVIGRVTITNYDPRNIDRGPEARPERAQRRRTRRTSSWSTSNPGHPKGRLPAVRRRQTAQPQRHTVIRRRRHRHRPATTTSDNDPRIGEVARNPRRAHAVEVTDDAPKRRKSRMPCTMAATMRSGRLPGIARRLTVLYQLFHLTVKDVSVTGVPMTISK